MSARRRGTDYTNHVKGTLASTFPLVMRKLTFPALQGIIFLTTWARCFLLTTTLICNFILYVLSLWRTLFMICFDQIKLYFETVYQECRIIVLLKLWSCALASSWLTKTNRHDQKYVKMIFNQHSIPKFKCFCCQHPSSWNRGMTISTLFHFDKQSQIPMKSIWQHANSSKDDLKYHSPWT